MTREYRSAASPVADSSTFGHPEESLDTVSVPVLCENHEKALLVEKLASVVVDTTEDKTTRSSPLYRLVLVVLLLASGLLMDARRLEFAASLLLP